MANTIRPEWVRLRSWIRERMFTERTKPGYEEGWNDALYLVLGYIESDEDPNPPMVGKSGVRGG